MAERISRDELRQLIREALREALGDAVPQASSRPAQYAGAPDRPARQGSFSLATGVLTEALVTKLATGHQKILIGREVVVTPLARERARMLKVEIVRQQP